MDDAHQQVKQWLTDKQLKAYVIKQLDQSLATIGFSTELIEDVTKHLPLIDVESFGKKHEEELQRVYQEGFFEDIVPRYFSTHVVPNMPAGRTVLDVGCGTGILAHILADDGKYQSIYGIDIVAYPQSEKHRQHNVHFSLVAEDEFTAYLKKISPDVVTITWTLHHMQYDEQERYLRRLAKNLAEGTKIVILEDAYSQKQQPQADIGVYDEFMRFTAQQRRSIMGTYDWVANRLLAQRQAVPIPCAYRTLEDWKDLCEGSGLVWVDSAFIGFPKERDINTPQAVFTVSVR